MSFLVREAEERIEKSKLVRIAGVINWKRVGSIE